MSTGFVLVGSVDAGKSSLSGQILYLSGALDEREYEKHKNESYKLLDVLEEEQNRGITVEVSRIELTIQGVPFTLLDCPGHKTYVTHVLAHGLSEASIAILVVSARKGELESALKDRIPELLLFLKGYNIAHIIVAVNKMDLDGWNNDIFATISERVRKELDKYRLRATAYVPVSGLTGGHIRNSVDAKWGPTLFETLVSVQQTLARSPPPVMRTINSIPRMLLRTTGNDLITKGYKCILHLGAIVVDAVVDEIREADTPGKVKPFLRRREKGEISLRLAKEISYDQSLTGCVLRTFKDTVGVGEIRS